MSKSIQQDNIRFFIKKIIKEAGLSNMPKDFLEEYEERLVIETQKRLGLAAVKELNKKDTIALAKIAEESNNDPKKISDFLISHINNFQEKMAKILAEFGKEVVEIIKDKTS